MAVSLDPLRPANLVAGWLAGLLAALSTPLVAAAGQGIGALLGGCGWIGITVPLDRQVWALVNEPTLDFAASGAAWGYWLGSLVLPALLGLAAIPLVPRPRTVAAELLMVHLAWNLTLVGLCWIPLLEPDDGHLVRFLQFRHLPPELVYLPAAGAVVGCLAATLRVLALARAAGPGAGRPARLAVVLFHLAPPTILYGAVGVALGGSLPLRALFAALVPVLAALGLAWSGFPRPWVFSLEPPTPGTVVRCAAGILVAGALLWAAGRPVEHGGRAGLLWGAPGAHDNIRAWVRPVPLLP